MTSMAAIQLSDFAKRNNIDIEKTPLESMAFATQMDAAPSIAATTFRSDFAFPKVGAVSQTPVDPASKDADVVYMVGNSLGLMPKAIRTLINQELDVWAERGVNGHFDHPHNRPWVTVDDNVLEETSRIVGAHSGEVAIMNTLTSNLHLVLASFYRPTSTRFKIIMESRAFPSDYFALSSQTNFHGFDSSTAVIEIVPREGERTLRTEDIEAVIEREGDSVALVLFSGVQYYTGQFFDIPRITRAAHAVGAMAGFDLAHAVGNVPLELHDWNVDCAVWCTYKYLNSGPGNIGGLFVHSKHNGSNLPRLTGWWGSDPASKFTMNNQFQGIPGAAGYRLSNPSVLATTSLLASLQTFAKTDMQALRAKSVLLTGYLEYLLRNVLAKERPGKFEIITPEDPSMRGTQLSLMLQEGQLERVFAGLIDRGVVADERRPDVIRISPAPLYCTFEDVFRVYLSFREVL
ncbi:hypothetical protein HDU83_005753 [Entophlyctis luteolus]|nr:hypothetical protein HDU82_003663 [Entophlyctis luteolus]KAJ3354147.1 hypothetical protein HDU83_005753 [Entophlyctis luteolus]KAJ3392664.1 hypothetical protein HDU84_003670 [Entophlyctis sp. JEL0112]